LQFVKSRDAFFRKISKIEENVPNADFLVQYKDGKQQPYLMVPNMENTQNVLSSFSKDQQIALVTLNNKKNRNELVKNWKAVVPYKLLTIYFANPYANGEKKWVVMPHVHSKVCDESSLGAGFNSLSELIEDISEDDVASKA
jgi:hypothetical protein